MTYEEWLIDKEEIYEFNCLSKESSLVRLNTQYKDPNGFYYITLSYENDKDRIIGYRTILKNTGNLDHIDTFFDDANPNLSEEMARNETILKLIKELYINCTDAIEPGKYSEEVKNDYFKLAVFSFFTELRFKANIYAGKL